MTDTVYLQHGKGNGPFRTERVKHRLTKRSKSAMPRHDTRTKIMVLHNSRWHRVHSENGKHFILANEFDGKIEVTLTGFNYE